MMNPFINAKLKKNKSVQLRFLTLITVITNNINALLYHNIKKANSRIAKIVL